MFQEIDLDYFDVPFCIDPSWHTVIYTNGDAYTGELMNNERHGWGKQVWKNNNIMYEGYWVRGQRDFFGTLYNFNAETQEKVKVYEGYWRNNKKHGCGTYFYSASEIYVGLWLNNQRSGWGQMQYENGDVYYGYWLKNKRHGKGIQMNANGDVFEGIWKDGEKNGPGKFFYMDKDLLYTGLWVNGAAVRGTITDLSNADTPRRTDTPIIDLENPDSVLTVYQDQDQDLYY